MTDKERLFVNKKGLKAISSWLAVLLCLLALAGCSHMSDAEKKVSNELKALQASETVGSEVVNLRNSLSDEGQDHFDGFLYKLRDFDFEITGSEEDESKDDDHTLVSVRIKTYDFGKEYLAVWTEFLRSHEDGLSEDDLIDFYELLFARLDALDEKSCIKNLKIVCIDPLDNGEWIAGIKDNEELQDAIFGGMLSEMKMLAAE